MRSLVAHFDAMGSVPPAALFDRPKTVVLKWNKDGEVLEYNPTFAVVMLDLGVGIELCWPRSGWQKGSVERITRENEQPAPAWTGRTVVRQELSWAVAHVPVPSRPS